MTEVNRTKRRPVFFLFLLVFALALLLAAITFTVHYRPGLVTRYSSDEMHAAFRFNWDLDHQPAALRIFLQQMPKGGDLHLHLTGAVYAETAIAEAAADHLCFDAATLTLVANHGVAGDKAVCAAGQRPAADALADPSLYTQLIDAFSMRGYFPRQSVTGHDYFFSTFMRFNILETAHAADWIHEVAARAATQNEQYVEAMVNPPDPVTLALAPKLAWNPDDLPAMRAQLLQGGIRADVLTAVRQFDAMDAGRARIEHCGEPNPDAACAVTVRYLYQVLRGFSPAQVFAQTLVGFEVAAASPRVVGINLVMPEDGLVTMRDYTLQMRMLDYLHSVYPQVNITLHAGELATGLVPPAGLRFHIRQAVELGHASRIGHGVDVLQEDDARQLLDELRDRRILVEINLSSNDVILGVRGADHPLRTYMRAHVPVALSTDDEGVSRIDITHEYLRAVTEQHLSYLDLKRMARASIEHSFLPGDDLWAVPDRYNHYVPACNNIAAQSCSNFIASSQRARQQMELERRFSVFEASIP
jgi:adenosine deaminase